MYYNYLLRLTGPFTGLLKAFVNRNYCNSKPICVSQIAKLNSIILHYVWVCAFTSSLVNPKRVSAEVTNLSRSIW